MVFDGNIEATELLLKIILKKDDIQVISVVGQREFCHLIIKLLLLYPIVQGLTILFFENSKTNALKYEITFSVNMVSYPFEVVNVKSITFISQLSNVWHISRDRRRMIDDDYSGFDVEKFYNIHIRGRKICGPEFFVMSKTQLFKSDIFL